MAAYFKIIPGTARAFWFNLIAPNNKKILTSEGYTTKQSCKDGITAVKKYCTDLKNFHSFIDEKGEYRFNLKAPNNEIIGRSEGYINKSDRDAAILAVQLYAPSAPIIE
jgi:uncharacterized protein YegP (UPF0339 family)